MENFKISKIEKNEFPYLLNQIHDPPQNLYILGHLPKNPDTKYLCVVGSRSLTPYGKEACQKIISGLRGYDISIVSGLALGMDTIAHKTAVEVGLHTIAIPGSGLDDSVLYPRANINLAKRILVAGGALISEEYPLYKATPYSFPKRNRIMAGISHATLVVEAEIKSGTLITSKYATEYNRDVCTIPGSIFSKKSDGPHMLIRLGATPIRTSNDVLELLGFDTTPTKETAEKTLQQKLLLCTPEERAALSCIATARLTRDETIRKLTEKLNKNVSEITALLVMLEIRELIKENSGLIFVT